MRYLLDTHAFLWFAADDERLSEESKRIYLAPQNDCLLSMVSVWEMAIKLSLNKLEMDCPLAQLIEIAMQRQRIQLLQIKLEHTLHVATLSFHHRDPFDRLLIAQSLVERLPILGCDVAFDAYGVQRIW